MATKVIWYHTVSNGVLKDVTHHGRDITIAGTVSQLSNNAPWLTAAGDNATTVNDDTYIKSIFDLTTIISGQQALVMLADYWPSASIPATDQQTFLYGAGDASTFILVLDAQHGGSGIARVRFASPIGFFHTGLVNAAAAMTPINQRHSLAVVLEGTNVTEAWCSLYQDNVLAGTFDASPQIGDIDATVQTATDAQGMRIFSLQSGNRAKNFMAIRYDPHPGAQAIVDVISDFHTNEPLPVSVLGNRKKR